MQRDKRESKTSGSRSIAGNMAQASNSRLPIVIALSIGVHLVAGILIMRLPAGQELLRKVIPVRLVERHKPPKREPPRPKPKLVKATPQSHPKSAPPPMAPSNDAGGETFGVNPGDTGGTMEVPVGNSLTVESTASAAPLVLDVSDDSGEAAIARRPTPIGGLRVTYPEVARLAGATGSAMVEAYVEADGHVSHASLVHATGAAFGRSALEAVRGSRFRPATRGGVNVACSIRLPIRFELSGEPTVEVDPTDLDQAEAPSGTASVSPSTESVVVPVASSSSAIATPSTLLASPSTVLEGDSR